MKGFNTIINCRGCNEDLPFSFRARAAFDFIIMPFQCSHCGSELQIQVKRGLFKRQLLIKVSMLGHTDKLLSILEERRTHA